MKDKLFNSRTADAIIIIIGFQVVVWENYNVKLFILAFLFVYVVLKYTYLYRSGKLRYGKMKNGRLE